MISIIMPAYNAERYIQEAIQSVLRQSYKYWELLVIDDDSADATSEIAERFTRLDSRIHYIRNEKNLGVAAARNKGVSLASGQWIAFLDSDDCWHPDKLKKQMDFAEKNNVEFVFSGSSFMDKEGRPLKYYLKVPRSISYTELLKQNIISCSSVLIKKTLIADFPMKHAEDLHEDFAVWLQILKNRHIEAFGIDEPLLIYRITSTSKSGNKMKAARMTYRVYRYLGLSPIRAGYYWLWYFYKSIKKYRAISRY